MLILLNKSLPFKLSKFNTGLKQLNEELGLQLNRLSIHLISDEALLDINKRYLNHDYLTDIITFDMRDEMGMEAELYLSEDRISENAQTFECTFMEEYLRVCIHGLLHLGGYEDGTPIQKKKMRELENKYLQKLFHVKRV